MYLAQLQAAREAGKKLKRLGWPKGQYMVTPKTQITVTDLNEDEAQALGMNPSASLITGENCNVLVLSPTQAVLGYELTHEDKTSQDWEEA